KNIRFKLNDKDGVIYFKEIFLEKNTTTGSSDDNVSNRQFEELVLRFELAARNFLSQYNIGVNKDPCANVYSKSCTTVGGLRGEILNALKELKTACDAWTGENNKYVNAQN